MTDKTKTEKIKDYNAKQVQQNTTVQETKTEEQTVIQKEAENTPAKREQDKRQEEIEQAQIQEERDAQDTLNKLGNKITEGQEAIANSASPFVRWLGNQPTPGGVATLVIILVFFLFAIVPVNEQGDTRLKLIWLTLLTRTKLNTSGESSTGGQGGGDFNVTPPLQINPPLPNIEAVPVVSNNGFSGFTTNELLNLFSFGE